MLATHCARTTLRNRALLAAIPSKHFSSSPFRSSSDLPTKVEHPTDSSQIRHFKDTRNVQPVPTAPIHPHEHTGDWVLFHPVYSTEEVKAVQLPTFETKTVSDKVAKFVVFLLRRGFDLVSGYRHSSPEAAIAAAKKAGKENLSVEELRRTGLSMSDQQWLNRIIFLETVAGVPGFVAAMIRHLQSLRLMKRDGGWIHMLLEEAENERMHLMTFIKVAQPGWFFRALILGAQGVFVNMFFFSYLISPKTCHRFVGMLEEQAVFTYTHAIKEVESGRIPEWSNKPAPGIAVEYWRMKKDATMLDLLYVVRADEATHRFVNHSLANLGAKDFNPFALSEPSAVVKGTKAGFTRDEALEWSKKTQEDLQEAAQKEAAASS